MITSSNGNTIRFNYDSDGHIVEAFSNDGRLLKYSYDGNGDLIQVTLPDASKIFYSYRTVNIKDDLFHLLIQETKPNGRVIKNDYDGQCRVTTQYATTGVSPKPTISGKFDYKITSNNNDNTINGTTTITDANNQTTTYEIDHNQITSITYPENRTLTQTWNITSRSLASMTDARGLTTSYQYDSQGNVTSRSLIGNITGSGSNETSTTSFKYNNFNCLSSITNPVGDITSYTYSDSLYPYNPKSIVTTTPSGRVINSIETDYTNTGGSFGLVSSLNNNGSIISYTYDKHGFLNSQTRKTGTQDPDVRTTLTCNTQGDITSSTDALGQRKQYFYDALSRTIGVETYDTTGARIDWHFNYYNYNGEIEWEQGARLNPVDYTHYDYDRAGHLLHKSTWLSAVSSSWNGMGVSSSDLATTSYSYDAQGNCTSITDPNGNITTMDYDNLGEMISRTTAHGAKETFTYEPGGKVATHTTVLGGKESYNYTSTGLLQSASRADGTTTKYHYDLALRLVEEIPSNGPSYSISYEGNTIKRTFNLSGTNLGSTSEVYDSRGNLLEKTDLAGNKWSYSYDGLNRIKSEEGPPSNSTQKTITHYYSLNFESIVNGLGEWVNRSFDALGRPILTTVFNQDGTVAQNISNHYSGDHQSVETTVGTGSSAITTTTFTDTRGLPLVIEHADGTCQQFNYDGNGNKTSFADEVGAKTTYTYDDLNHLTSETLPGGAVIKYSYNAAGELLTRSMPAGITEQNSYDEAGQKIASSLIGSDKSITRNFAYGYTNGLLSSITDPRGFKTSISYDDWMRPTSLISSGSSVPEQNQTTIYQYDPRGLLTSVAQHYNDPSTGASTEVSRAYDAYGQLTSEITSLNGKSLSSWSQSWDGAGRRTALNWNLDKQGQRAQYHFAYNALGEMTSSQNASGTCSYSYADNGLINGKNSPFGKLLLARDNLGRIGEEATQRNNDQATLLYEHMDWKPNNTLLDYKILGSALGFPQETRNYNYDARNRMTSEEFIMFNSPNQQSLPNGPQMAQYLFDETAFLQLNSGHSNGQGVRTTQIINGNNANCVASENSFAQVTQANTYLFGTLYDWTLSYDPSGNLVTHSLENATDQRLTWDSFNRLVNIDQKSILSHLLNAQWSKNYSWKTIYDGLGRRIQTSSEGSTINYYYDPEVEFLELGHCVNGVHTWSLYGPDRSGTYGGAQGIGGLESTYNESTDITYDHVKNVFGDTVGIYTDNQAAPYVSVLGAYGPMLGSSVNGDLCPQWRGHYLDPTGFYYMGARYYDPVDGRFLSADPLGHGSSLSLYDYCNGDPVNGLDPDGRCAERVNNLVDNVSYSWNQADNQYDADTGIRILAGIPVSILSGDAFTHYITPEEYMSQHESMPQAFSANGIFAGDQTIKNIRSATASGLALNEKIFFNSNPSYGPLDLIRAGGQQAGVIDITALRAADMINASGGGTFVAHSNGAALFYAASPLLKPEVKANISYKGYGPQININQTNDPGLRSYYNDAGSNDWIAKGLNPDAHWDRVIPQSPFQLYNNHMFINTYAPDIH